MSEGGNTATAGLVWFVFEPRRLLRRLLRCLLVGRARW